jgi:pyridoxal 5'-phosphate synthase pdxS subunit
LFAFIILGVDGIFVGSNIFESSDPDKMAKAICLATTYYNDYNKVTDACDLSGISMIDISENKYELR